MPLYGFRLTTFAARPVFLDWDQGRRQRRRFCSSEATIWAVMSWRILLLFATGFLLRGERPWRLRRGRSGSKRMKWKLAVGFNLAAMHNILCFPDLYPQNGGLVRKTVSKLLVE